MYHKSSNPAATPFNTESAINHYVQAGRIQPSKIVLGLPLYGRAFLDTDGPGTPFRGGVGDGSWEKGVWDYKVLPQPGAKELVDDEAGASYSFDGTKRVAVSYDNPEIAKRKAAYITKRGLAGAMWWESSGDAPADHERSLISTVSRAPSLDSNGSRKRSFETRTYCTLPEPFQLVHSISPPSVIPLAYTQPTPLSPAPFPQIRICRLPSNPILCSHLMSLSPSPITVSKTSTSLLLTFKQVVKSLSLESSENTLSYPESVYDNLRNGFP